MKKIIILLISTVILSGCGVVQTQEERHEYNKKEAEMCEELNLNAKISARGSIYCSHK